MVDVGVEVWPSFISLPIKLGPEKPEKLPKLEPLDEEVGVLV